MEGADLLGGAAWVAALAPGSRELAVAVAGALAQAPAAVLDRHGAVTVAADLEWALRRMLLLERMAELTAEDGR